MLVDLGVADPVEALPGPSVQTDEQIMQYIGEAMITVSRSISDSSEIEQDDADILSGYETGDIHRFWGSYSA